MNASASKPLENQAALVTGASSGIGRGIALRLAAAGAAVGVNYIGNDDAAREVVDGITKAGGRAIEVQGDVGEEPQVEAMVRQTVEAFGSLDIMVANAGIQKDASIGKMSLADWNRVIQVNLTGQFLCCRAAIAEFRRRGPRPDVSRALGKIVCMSSVHQVIPWAGHVNYASSKGGIHMLMQSLAQEVAPERIRVNAVAPGAIRTNINRPAWETKEALDKLLQLVPYGRIGEVEDIAEAVLYLVSDAADYVTGTTLFVDGGMTLYPGFADNG
jgi:glucose 1-dehydrogenase